MSMLHRQQSLEKQGDVGDDEMQNAFIRTTNPWYASTKVEEDSHPMMMHQPPQAPSSTTPTTPLYPPGVALRRKNSKQLNGRSSSKSEMTDIITSLQVPLTGTTIRRRGRSQYIDEESDMYSGGMFIHSPRHSRRSRSIPREMKYAPLSQDHDVLDEEGRPSRSGSVSSISNNSSSFEATLDADMNLL